MNKSIDYFLKYIPIELVKEIFTFIIPDKKKITFNEHMSNFIDINYGEKYQIAYINNDCLLKENKLLSRIEKKKGKHRYYITTRTTTIVYCNDCENEYPCFKNKSRYLCKGHDMSIENHYTSKYIGKNIDIALLEWSIASK